MDSNIIKACLIRFFGTAFLTIGQTYASMIFLSIYPASWLPYLFLINGSILFAVKYVTRDLILKGVRRIVINNNIAYIIILGVFVFLMYFPQDWIRFGLTVALQTIAFCIISDNWLIISKAFNIREFKRVGNWVILASSLGAVISGIIIPISLKFLPPLALLYVLLAILFILLFIVKSMKVDEIEESDSLIRSSQKILNKQPLYIQLFAGLVVVFGIYTLSEFSFMSQLTLNYTQKEIGNILAPFYAGINIVIIFLQLFVTQRIIQRFTVTGLFYAFPIGTSIAALFMILYPGFWTALIVSGTANVLRYSSYTLGQQMAINVFPGSLRFIANYQLQNTGRNIGVGVASALLISMAGYYDLHIIGIMIIVLGIGVIYLTHLTKLSYEANLKNSINLHRFNVDFIGSTGTDNLVTQNVASLAIQSDADDVKLFGLSLLQTLDLKTVPKYLLDSLSSTSPEVRIETIKTLRKIKEPTVPYILTQHIAKEPDPEVVWELIKALIKDNGKNLLPMAQHFLKSDDFRFRACGILITVRFDPNTPIDKFIEMINSPDPKVRIWACRILRQGDLDHAPEYLLKLINDPNLSVSREAVLAAEKHHNHLIIETILDKLIEKQMYPEIRRTLFRIGPKVIPQMGIKIEGTRQIGMIKSAINILSEFPEQEAEDQIVKFLDSKNSLIQETSIMQLPYRGQKIPLSEKAKETTKKLMFEEEMLLQQYQMLLDENNDSDFQREVQTLIKGSRKKFLYLLAAYSKSNTILQLLPTILRPKMAGAEYHRAIELLDIKVEDRDLANIIPYALEDRKDAKTIMPEITTNFNPWLYQVHEFKIGKLKGKPMEITQRVLVLRKVDLFSSLSADVLEYIAEHLNVIDVAAGQEIFKEGDIPNGLYIVGRGSVSIMRGTFELSKYESSGFFGELGLFDNEPRTGTAIATSDSVLFLLEKGDFNRLTDDIPEILKVVVQTIIGYLRQKLL